MPELQSGKRKLTNKTLKNWNRYQYLSKTGNIIIFLFISSLN